MTAPKKQSDVQWVIDHARKTVQRANEMGLSSSYKIPLIISPKRFYDEYADIIRSADPMLFSRIQLIGKDGL